MAIENKCCLRWRKASVQSHIICSFQFSELNAFENANTQSTHINKMLFFFFRTKLETIPTTLASVKQPPNLTVVRCSLHGHGAFSENATQVTKQTPQRVEIQVNDSLSLSVFLNKYLMCPLGQPKNFGAYSQTPKWTTFFLPVAISQMLPVPNISKHFHFSKPVYVSCGNMVQKYRLLHSR